MHEQRILVIEYIPFFLTYQVKYLRHARIGHNNFLIQYKILHCYPIDKIKLQGYSTRILASVSYF